MLPNVLPNHPCGNHNPRISMPPLRFSHESDGVRGGAKGKNPDGDKGKGRNVRYPTPIGDSDKS
eukprot:3356245-Amphidinium_carterae.1